MPFRLIHPLLLSLFNLRYDAQKCSQAVCGVSKVVQKDGNLKIEGFASSLVLELQVFHQKILAYLFRTQFLSQLSQLLFHFPYRASVQQQIGSVSTLSKSYFYFLVYERKYIPESFCKTTWEFCRTVPKNFLDQLLVYLLFLNFECFSDRVDNIWSFDRTFFSLFSTKLDSCF